MAAHYTPYRDEEESVDALEATSWSDNERSCVGLQIYEKTTEELPSKINRRTLWIQVMLFLIIGVLGFTLGYFASFEEIIEHKSDAARDYAEFNFLPEDPTIKDRILSNVDGTNILKTLTKYQDTNRIPGSDPDHKFADDISELFHGYGFQTTSKNYSFRTMLPSKPSIVKMLSKTNRTLYSNNEQEKYVHDDMRPFLPLSQAEAAVIYTDQIVYVNQGTKEDYMNLTKLGVTLNTNSSEGKVFVIRQTFYQAHNILMNAQEIGARAVLLFPDPETYGESSHFPSSLRLPNDAGRSHPIAWSNYGDLAMYSFSSASGIESSKSGLEKETKIHIPIIPISYNTAAKLLRGLSGPQAPNEWNCFDFTLYLGPGYREENNEEQRDKILIEFNNQETTINSAIVTGVITGAVEPDRYVIIGSRRDSLNRGMLDSLSGTAVMLELARVFSTLMKEGWQPRRSIIFNSYGVESLNLMGSSHWLELHQRLLHSRAVAYLNCDLVVIGNHSVSISASPLLYQTLYNATHQVPSPHINGDHVESVYETWKRVHEITRKIDLDIESKSNGTKTDSILDTMNTIHEVHSRLTKEENPIDAPGSILHEYKLAATVKTRPRLRKLDLQSSYSPFFLYAGIPVVDVRYAGFPDDNTNVLEDMLPLLGTKYDNLAAIQHIDPHLTYHVTVTKVLGEIVRDLSDSTFLPFNLLDYAVTLKEAFDSLVAQSWKTLIDSNVETESLKSTIKEFYEAAISFHHRQDLSDIKDAMKVRKFNDQLMLLERAFLDPIGMPNYWERKHIILTHNDGNDSSNSNFPGLVDWITLIENEAMDPSDLAIFVEILKMHVKAVVYTILSAVKIIQEVNLI